MHTAYYHSPIGILRVTVTDSYVQEVHFCNDDEKENVVADAALTPLLQQCLDELIEYFQGVRKQFDLPVHQEGTSFQQSVWSELTAIPYGRTISYLELSRRLGDPKAIRAAASTNGKNQVAIIVPCHRVIGSNRELIGYAGGLWRKRWLLEHEKKVHYGVQTLF
ncbi:methylated-DNA--[protein]-cysteine S-methyltransferase [Flavihumibacter solisilvae]|uniref:Methylated-DNA--protein-cysteine methyltransferase n=1 Tax=Flavihumibacter solisilvae TaxID=1349421 RepID=A0A0C1L1I8_9BACT|nr:methylated-DNA--[protein]-cysteine S-methyltransferase [Flavihumibacter solisilvae]KIC93887.1 cysteine methyltransferase [Flavihumibacter solisilvae]